MPIKYKPSYQEIIIKMLKLKQRNRFLQHKANKYDRYLSSEGTYPIKIVANNYGLTSTQVNHILENNSIQYKIHNH